MDLDSWLGLWNWTLKLDFGLGLWLGLWQYQKIWIFPVLSWVAVSHCSLCRIKTALLQNLAIINFMRGASDHVRKGALFLQHKPENLSNFFGYFANATVLLDFYSITSLYFCSMLLLKHCCIMLLINLVQNDVLILDKQCILPIILVWYLSLFLRTWRQLHFQVTQRPRDDKTMEFHSLLNQ